ncbi:hypothetical protein ES703_94299 [subsurface metagenome]
MITEKGWNQAFEHIVPTVSLAVGTLSVLLATMALTRSSPLGRRAYHLDGQYLVSVRYPGQWHDIREFIQPDNPDVLAVYSQIGPDAWQLLDYVCRNISYRRDVGEFWQTPSETLRGYGDCEDSAILLASLIRAGEAPNCYVALGSLGGYGHAWCEHNGQVMETTYTSARLVSNLQDYCPYVIFNDREVIELWPSALEDLFSLRRNEVTKLNLMAQAIGNEVPPECPSCWPFLAVGLVTGGILGTGFAMILQKGEEAR